MLEYFKIEFWLDPQGKTETSLCLSFLLFLFPCEESSDFQIEYSAAGLKNIQITIEVWVSCMCVNNEHIYTHIHIFSFRCICFCSLYSNIWLESDIINTVLLFFLPSLSATWIPGDIITLVQMLKCKQLILTTTLKYSICEERGNTCKTAHTKRWPCAFQLTWCFTAYLLAVSPDLLLFTEVNSSFLSHQKSPANFLILLVAAGADFMWHNKRHHNWCSHTKIKSI